ncbi:sensor domain-containing diguanylate cyclase [uncultured Pseudoalteromonas sp.]|uniref:sensor domain-containing diguanylate cyclase n=1 Tax=uncultured Pseudoalteromonas sp. TaxID=114053 RepID=UPI0030C83178
MINDKAFFKLVLDTMPDQVVVINSVGDIVYINRSWQNFGEQNDCACCEVWEQQNYLTECEKAAKKGDEFGLKALNGITSVISGTRDDFYLEYPCHSEDEKRWFMMRVVSFNHIENGYYAISHQNITERKLAEELVQKQLGIDGLTNIANRGYFDEFLIKEWNRCKRLNMPLSLVIIDLDDFKLLNDTYGHQQGDTCLKKVANLLKDFAKRPSDLCARFGGEEFVLVYGNTNSDQACNILYSLQKAFLALNIENKHSLPNKKLTVSMGATTVVPCDSFTSEELLKEADDLLYKAKNQGKNQLCVSDLNFV